MSTPDYHRIAEDARGEQLWELHADLQTAHINAWSQLADGEEHLTPGRYRDLHQRTLELLDFIEHDLSVLFEEHPLEWYPDDQQPDARVEK